ncbi:MAG: nuclear transport factor 2 family protein [Solirubrobacterales bacterium]
MSEADVDVVRGQFAAVNKRDFARAMDLYADDVTLTVGVNARLMNPGVYEGKEAVGEWFGDWFRTFAADYRFEIEEARTLEGGAVFVHANHRGSGRRSGVEVHREDFYLYRVSGGKVSRVGFFGSRDAALEAASLPEWS